MEEKFDQVVWIYLYWSTLYQTAVPYWQKPRAATEFDFELYWFSADSVPTPLFHKRTEALENKCFVF